MMINSPINGIPKSTILQKSQYKRIKDCGDSIRESY